MGDNCQYKHNICAECNESLDNAKTCKEICKNTGCNRDSKCHYPHIADLSVLNDVEFIYFSSSDEGGSKLELRGKIVKILNESAIIDLHNISRLSLALIEPLNEHDTMKVLKTNIVRINLHIASEK
jgi:hypothetical protein